MDGSGELQIWRLGQEKQGQGGECEAASFCHLQKE
jgi:hypothetical protein